MLPLKLRLRLLSKLAQTVPGDSTSPTSPNAPSEPVSTTNAVLPPPPSFQASAAWGWLPNVYNSYSVTTLNNLVSTINTALHYASEGKYNFQKLKNNNFNVDPSGERSVDAKNLINLAKMVYQTYLNSGNQPAQKITGSQIIQWNTQLSQSQPFLNLSQISPSGTLAQKMPGNLKDNILNITRELARANPIQQPQQQ